MREYPEYPSRECSEHAVREYSEHRYQLNAGVCCPITMTFAAAPALDAYANTNALNPPDAPSLAQTLLAVRAAAAHVGALRVLKHGVLRVLTHGVLQSIHTWGTPGTHARGTPEYSRMGAPPPPPSGRAGSARRCVGR
jgi:hypothetical protein